MKTQIPNPPVEPAKERSLIDNWIHPAVIARNNFVHKSLSCWSLNIAVGCNHACRFCYVADSSTISLGEKLAEFGVSDPDLQWGSYVLVRPWDEKKFLSSLNSAENIPLAKLNADGNRAVMLCTTTDPYQVLFHEDPDRCDVLNREVRYLVTRSLELIRDRSTLNVRILTRSPLAKLDFDLYRSFGPRLMFGMSLPTLRNDLAKIYEPKAPSPSQRLKTLRAAKEAGINVFVAIAPTYPDCDKEDLATTLKAVAEINPLTVYMEPINIHAKNVERITEHARELGMSLKTDVFATPQLWQEYALQQLRSVEALAADFGLSDRLHLWPDPSLGNQKTLAAQSDPYTYYTWLQSKWNRVSEWPK